MIETSDILYLLSGGTANTSAAASLGGDPSVTAVPARLFSDLSPAETTAGTTDYRCLYIANDNATDTLYHAVIFIADEVADGASVELGFVFQDDIQQVTVNGGTLVTGGSFDLLYDGTSFTVSHDSDVSVWASNFQTALRAVGDNLADVTVSATTSGTRVVFEVEFAGIAGNRYHPALAVDDDTGLTPTATVSILKTVDGGPINTIAPEIDSAKTAPNGISFFAPTESAPLALGQLRPEDMVPVWIKRACPANTAAMADDGFTLKLLGEPID